LGNIGSEESSRKINPVNAVIFLGDFILKFYCNEDRLDDDETVYQSKNRNPRPFCAKGEIEWQEKRSRRETAAVTRHGIFHTWLSFSN
jgi:hypothetical protein